MSVKKNYFYNVLYQIISVLIPLVTVPYLSRVIKSTGIGINAYTLSIVQYFILLGTLGISMYGNRTIAYVRNDSKELSKNFWSIILLQVITTSIALIAYYIFFIFFNEKYKWIFIIQGLNILSATVDISWFFMGMEQFKKTVTRNLMVRVLGLICIFVFVKQYDDLWKYVLINASSTILGQLVMWMYIPKMVSKVKLSFNDIKKHIMPSISLFIPQIATQIYVILGKTITGAIAGPAELGYYENAEKMVKVSLAIVTSLGTVMMPRVSNVFSQKDYKKIQEYINQSFKFVNYLSIPIMFGIAGISINFAPWFFGKDFVKSGYLMIILSLINIGIAWGSVTGIQYMIPVGKVKEYTYSVTSGAIVYLIINISLVPYIKSYGAAIATVVTEFVVAFVQLYYIRKDIKISDMFQGIWKPLLSGFIMFLLVKELNSIMIFNKFSLVIQIVSGILVYIIGLTILRCETNAYMIKSVKKILKR